MTCTKDKPRRERGAKGAGQWTKQTHTAADGVDLGAPGERPCATCAALTKRSSGMCRRCDPTSKRNTEQRGSETPQEVLARFEEHLASYTTGEDWRRWLDAQAQFHNYSARNVMLILDQRPNASCVAGARKWEELGRAPVDGERAIHILAPATIKDPDHPESPDRRKLVGFRVVKVYDISQTDGDPLPSLTRTLEGDAPAAMIERLDAAAADLGAVVATANAVDDLIIANGANGYATKRDDGTLHVVLSDRLSPAQRAKTYAHEIGHIALGHLDEDRSTAHTLRADREVQAESFAYVMSSSYGLDTGDFSFSYVSAWSGGDPKAVARSAARIASAVGPYCRDAA